MKAMGINMAEKSSSVARVRQAINQLNLPTELKELPGSTRTALEAAEAVNCQVGQIVKSLVFKTIPDNQPLLILTSGSNRVDEKHLSKLIGQKISFAKPDFVRNQTGFAIGGVAPLGLKKEIPTYIDQDLLLFSVIWAAAGSPRTVFSITPQKLVEITDAKIISVK
jgi:prolyl-tRNA editing enzyme YbaK/EbsC (Cys-tRNA(Pro) deacylase)